MQGLYLTAHGDRLMGRADNGFLWSWDLSRTLGWDAFRPTAAVDLSTFCGAGLDLRQGGCGGAALPADSAGSLGAVNAGVRGSGGATTARKPAWSARGEGDGSWLSEHDDWQQVGGEAHFCVLREFLPCWISLAEYLACRLHQQAP